MTVGAVQSVTDRREGNARGKPGSYMNAPYTNPYRANALSSKMLGSVSLHLPPVRALTTHLPSPLPHPAVSPATRQTLYRLRPSYTLPPGEDGALSTAVNFQPWRDSTAALLSLGACARVPAPRWQLTLHLFQGFGPPWALHTRGAQTHMQVNH